MGETEERREPLDCPAEKEWMVRTDVHHGIARGREKKRKPIIRKGVAFYFLGYVKSR